MAKCKHNRLIIAVVVVVVVVVYLFSMWDCSENVRVHLKHLEIYTTNYSNSMETA